MRQIGRQYKLNKTTGQRTDEELKVKDYTVPVKTLPTILDELKHTRIAILKLDVNRDEIRSRLGKWIKQNLRLGAHEMRVEK